MLKRSKVASHYGKFLVYFTNHVISRVVVSSVRKNWYRKVMKFEIGSGTSILTDFKVSQRANLSIGEHSVINNGCRFDNRFPIRIGSSVSVSFGTIFLTKGHDIDARDFRTKGARVVIEDYVWLCTNVLIQPGVTIGRGAVVLPGSVVTRDIDPFDVVGGNPAVFIRKRAQDLEYKLNWDPWVPFFG